MAVFAAFIKDKSWKSGQNKYLFYWKNGQKLLYLYWKNGHYYDLETNRNLFRAIL